MKDDLEKKIIELQKFQHRIELKEEIDEEVQTEVRAKCALVWGWISICTAVAVGIITFYSTTVKEASKAALKVIIARITQ